MNLWRSLAGVMELELLSADPLGAAEAIAAADIPLFHILPDGELTLRFRIPRGAYPQLCRLTRKRGEKLRVLRRLGLFWPLQSFFHRPVLAAGLAFLLALSLWIPTRVFFIRVEGNKTLPARQILAAAEQCGIGFGASRRVIRSEKMKNSLLAQLPELRWAGINTRGCVAVIQVAEGEAAPEAVGQSGLCHLVAARDGVITSLTATAGTPLCGVGQTVTRGQVLISGVTDCGIAVKIQQAQGEVMAQTRREIRVVTPEKRYVRREAGKKQRRLSLLLGKKRIKLWIGSGIWDTTCDRMYQEYPLVLPGGFRLPVALAVETLRESTLEEELLPDASQQLGSFAKARLRQQMLSGRILQARETLSQESGVYCLTGSYSCQELISRPKWEKIGETHE